MGSYAFITFRDFHSIVVYDRWYLQKSVTSAHQRADATKQSGLSSICYIRRDVTMLYLHRARHGAVYNSASLSDKRGFLAATAASVKIRVTTDGSNKSQWLAAPLT